MEHQNVIELNGKRYDALTGTLLGKSLTPVVPVSPQKGRVIDGFVRPASRPAMVKPTPVKVSVKTSPVTVAVKSADVTPAAPKPAKPAAASAPIKKKITVRDHHSIPVKAHHPEHAKTLMRSSVHKPTVTIKPASKVQPKVGIAPKPMSAIALKRSGYQVDPRRLEHAKAAPKHEAVKHFTAPQAVPQDGPVHHIPTQVAALAVTPAPHHSTSVPAPHVPAHRDIFEAAIANATSHEQPMHKPSKSKRHRRFVNITAGIAAFLVIGGFIGYLNMPGIEVKVASFQAGFGAQLPGYKPTGFALRDGVQRSGNTVSMTYQSGEQSYTITQQPSDWNSQTLADNTMALGNDHEKIQVDGRTVYIYGGNSAVWVDGNVRYDVTGNARLTSEDLTAIAASL